MDKKGPSMKILVVDDEKIVRQSLGDWLRDDGFDVTTASGAPEALRHAADQAFDLAFLDIRMPGVDGLELQRRLAAAQPDLTVVIMTAYASVESAVDALKAGAYDYLTKPFDPDQLSHLVRRAAEHRSLRTENLELKQRIAEASATQSIVGRSPAIRRVLDLIDAVADTDATVLVRGESGTGKELVARALHARSSRRYGPLVVINCGALAPGVLESELFGHERGSFTGATARRKGKFELADGGTIFLDEIGAVPEQTQVELLRVLEDKRVTRVGGERAIQADFRVVAATNQDLEALSREGSFREDLFWRLTGFVIPLPPLRERVEDIVPLAEHFLERFATSMSRPALTLADGAKQALEAYAWPGNVRELQNAVERSIVLCSGSSITPADLPVRVTAHAVGAGPAARSLEAVEKSHIERVLRETDWNITRSAKILGVDRGTLYNKIRKYDLRSPEVAQPGTPPR